jgi:hypothetical protein
MCNETTYHRDLSDKILVQFVASSERQSNRGKLLMLGPVLKRHGILEFRSLVQVHKPKKKWT